MERSISSESFASLFQYATLQQVRTHIENNDSIGYMDSNMNTPLIIASEYNTLEVVEFLSTIYDCDAQNSKHESSVHKAIKHNNLNAVKYLIKKSKNTYDFTNCIKIMAKNPHIEVLEYFLQRNTVTSTHMRKLLKHSCRRGNRAYVQYLITNVSSILQGLTEEIHATDEGV